MSDIQIISKREFLRNTSRYLKVGRYKLEGRDDIMVEVSDIDTRKPASMSDKYGCGCRKVDGKVLCSKHGRY